MSANTPGWSRSQAAVEPALEPEEAGADFPIQGEYLGKVGNVTPMGAQVIALGGGAFKAVFLPGGLPGQGWNGKDRVEAAGTLTGGKAGFSGGGYSATVVADGSILSGTTDKGEPFTFDKIHRKSPTEGALPPAGAIVLFDGSGVAAWKDGSAGIDARELFRPVGAASTAGAVTKAAFQDFTLHLEFRVPFQPTARYTSRGNSGVYLQSRYEVQVLDSFGIRPGRGGHHDAQARVRRHLRAFRAPHRHVLPSPVLADLRYRFYGRPLRRRRPAHQAGERDRAPQRRTRPGQARHAQPHPGRGSGRRRGGTAQIPGLRQSRFLPQHLDHGRFDLHSQSFQGT